MEFYGNNNSMWIFERRVGSLFFNGGASVKQFKVAEDKFNSNSMLRK